MVFQANHSLDTSTISKRPKLRIEKLLIQLTRSPLLSRATTMTIPPPVATRPHPRPQLTCRPIANSHTNLLPIPQPPNIQRIPTLPIPQELRTPPKTIILPTQHPLMLKHRFWPPSPPKHPKCRQTIGIARTLTPTPNPFIPAPQLGSNGQRP